MMQNNHIIYKTSIVYNRYPTAEVWNTCNLFEKQKITDTLKRLHHTQLPRAGMSINPMKGSENICQILTLLY